MNTARVGIISLALIGAIFVTLGCSGTSEAEDTADQALTNSCSERARFEGAKFGPVSEAIQGITVLKNGNIAVTTSLESYTAGQDPHVYILDKNLQKVGAFTAGHRQQLTAAPVELASGAIVATSLEGVVYFVDGAGKSIAKFDTKETISSSALVLEDDTVVVSTWQGNIYFLGPDGSLKKKIGKPGSSFHVTGAVAKDGTIVLGDERLRVFFLAADGSEKSVFRTEGSQVRAVAARPDGSVMVVTRGGYGTLVFDTAGAIVHEAHYSMDDVTVFGDGSFALAGGELIFLTSSGTATNRHFFNDRDRWSKPVVLADNKVVSHAYDTDTKEARLRTFDEKGVLLQENEAFNLGVPVAAIDSTSVVTRDVSGRFMTVASCW